MKLRVAPRPQGIAETFAGKEWEEAGARGRCHVYAGLIDSRQAQRRACARWNGAHCRCTECAEARIEIAYYRECLRLESAGQSGPLPRLASVEERRYELLRVRYELLGGWEQHHREGCRKPVRCRRCRLASLLRRQLERSMFGQTPWLRWQHRHCKACREPECPLCRIGRPLMPLVEHRLASNPAWQASFDSGR